MRHIKKAKIFYQERILVKQLLKPLRALVL